MALAVVGTAAVLLVFDDEGERSGGDPSPTPTTAWSPPEVPTVWPENPVTTHVTDPATIQRLVDRGDRELRWRTDPEEVARRFAATVLGWSDPSVVALDADFQSDRDLRAFEVSPCPPGAVCDVAVPLPTVWLTQPVDDGTGGIWSVVSVQSEPLRIDVPAGRPAELVAGKDLRFRLTSTTSDKVHVGLVASNGCGSVADFEPGLSFGPAALQVPNVPGGAGCGDAVGYAFAYAQDATVVPIGDPLLESAPIEWPYLTIVPVIVRAPEASNA
jgi:hypothetical protein